MSARGGRSKRDNKDINVGGKSDGRKDSTDKAGSRYIYQICLSDGDREYSLTPEKAKT